MNKLVSEKMNATVSVTTKQGIESQVLYSNDHCHYFILRLSSQN